MRGRFLVAVAVVLAGCGALVSTSGLAGGDGDGDGDDGGDGERDAAARDDGATGTPSRDAAASLDAGVDAPVTCEADLTNDPRNCGRCGLDCAGGACQDGFCTPVTVATLLQEAFYLDISAGNLYVGEFRDNGRLFRIPTAAGALVPLGNVNGVFDLVAQPDGVVFTSSGRSPLVRRVPLGSTTTDVVGDAGLGLAPSELAVIGPDVWVSAVLPGGTPGLRGRLLRFAPGGAATLLAEDTDMRGITADANRVFVIGSGRIFVFGRGGSAPERTINVTTNVPRRLASDAQHLYVVSFGDTRVVRIDKTTGAEVTVGTDTANVESGSVLVDETHVYWTSPRTGTIKRAPKSGEGPTETVVRGVPTPTGLASDGTFLYFTAFGTMGTADAYVARLAK